MRRRRREALDGSRPANIKLTWEQWLECGLGSEAALFVEAYRKGDASWLGETVSRVAVPLGILTRLLSDVKDPYEKKKEGSFLQIHYDLCEHRKTTPSVLVSWVQCHVRAPPQLTGDVWPHYFRWAICMPHLWVRPDGKLDHSRFGQPTGTFFTLKGALPFVWLDAGVELCVKGSKWPKAWPELAFRLVPTEDSHSAVVVAPSISGRGWAQSSVDDFVELDWSSWQVWPTGRGSQLGDFFLVLTHSDARDPLVFFNNGKTGRLEPAVWARHQLIDSGHY